MKTFKLKYKTYKELQEAQKRITLARLIYEIAKNVSTQNEIEWIALDNVSYILSSLRNASIKSEDIPLISEAVKEIKEFGYFDVEEKMVGHFSKSLCVKVLR